MSSVARASPALTRGWTRGSAPDAGRPIASRLRRPGVARMRRGYEDQVACFPSERPGRGWGPGARGSAARSPPPQQDRSRDRRIDLNGPFDGTSGPLVPPPSPPLPSAPSVSAFSPGVGRSLRPSGAYAWRSGWPLGCRGSGAWPRRCAAARPAASRGCHTAKSQVTLGFVSSLLYHCSTRWMHATPRLLEDATGAAPEEHVAGSAMAWARDSDVFHPAAGRPFGAVRWVAW